MGTGEWIPSWRRVIFDQLLPIKIELVQHGFSTALDREIRQVLKAIPGGALDVTPINFDSKKVSIQMLRKGLRLDRPDMLLDAMNYGERTQTFPLAFSWAICNSAQRKYIMFCFIRHSAEDPCLPAFPCSLLQLIEYAKWLPTFGCDASGWPSVRHYIRAVRAWSRSLGWDDPKLEDPEGWKTFKANYSANFIVRRKDQPEPVEPGHIRHLATCWPEDTRYAGFFRLVCGLLFYTGLRPGHLLPKSTSHKHCRNLVRFSSCLVETGDGRPVLSIEVRAAKGMLDNHDLMEVVPAECICTPGGPEEPLCPVHAYLRWRDQYAPPCREGQEQWLTTWDETGRLFLREAFSRHLRRALREHVFCSISAEMRERIVQMIAPRSFRIGTGTALAGDSTISDVQLSVAMMHKNVQTTRTSYVRFSAAKRARIITGRLAHGSTLHGA